MCHLQSSITLVQNPYIQIVLSGIQTSTHQLLHGDMHMITISQIHKFISIFPGERNSSFYFCYFAGRACIVDANHQSVRVQSKHPEILCIFCVELKSLKHKFLVDLLKPSPEYKYSLVIIRMLRQVVVRVNRILQVLFFQVRKQKFPFTLSYCVNDLHKLSLSFQLALVYPAMVYRLALFQWTDVLLTSQENMQNLHYSNYRLDGLFNMKVYSFSKSNCTWYKEINKLLSHRLGGQGLRRDIPQTQILIVFKIQHKTTQSSAMSVCHSSGVSQKIQQIRDITWMT